MPVKDKVATFQFNRKIVIQKPTAGVDDDQGGGLGPSAASEYVDYYTCFADIQNQPHGRGLFRKFLLQQLYPQLTTIIQIRYQQTFPIDATCQVKYIAHGIMHIYKILGIENTAEANISMYLLCREDQAKAVN